MGETAEMMLDGTLCEGCGVYLGADIDCPCLCDDCAKSRREEGRAVERVGKVWVDSGPATGRSATAAKPATKVKCPICARVVKVAGLQDHNRAMHSAGSTL